MPNMLTNEMRSYDKPNKQMITMRMAPELLRHFTARAETELGGRGRTKLMEKSMRKGEEYAELVADVAAAFAADDELYALYAPTHEETHVPVWKCDGVQMDDLDAATLTYIKAAVREKLSRDTTELVG